MAKTRETGKLFRMNHCIIAIKICFRRKDQKPTFNSGLNRHQWFSISPCMRREIVGKIKKGRKKKKTPKNSPSYFNFF